MTQLEDSSVARPVKNDHPLELNQALNLVNKVKYRFAQQPEIYKAFLAALRSYQTQAKSVTEVHAQVAKLFVSTPDLMEEFELFLPESAARAKAQTAKEKKTRSTSLDTELPGRTSTRD